MQGAGCRVQGAGCRVQGAGCRGTGGLVDGGVGAGSLLERRDLVPHFADQVLHVLCRGRKGLEVEFESIQKVLV